MSEQGFKEVKEKTERLDNELKECYCVLSKLHDLSKK